MNGLYPRFVGVTRTFLASGLLLYSLLLGSLLFVPADELTTGIYLLSLLNAGVSALRAGRSLFDADWNGFSLKLLPSELLTMMG